MLFFCFGCFLPCTARWHATQPLFDEARIFFACMATCLWHFKHWFFRAAKAFKVKAPEVKSKMTMIVKSLRSNWDFIGITFYKAPLFLSKIWIYPVKTYNIIFKCNFSKSSSASFISTEQCMWNKMKIFKGLHSNPKRLFVGCNAAVIRTSNQWGLPVQIRFRIKALQMILLWFMSQQLLSLFI